MVQQFFVKINGAVYGPFGGQKIQEMAQSGQLAPDDEIRLATTKEWLKARNFKGLQFDAAPIKESAEGANLSQQNVGIPSPPAYPAISFFIGLYNFNGYLTIILGVIAIIFIAKSNINDQFRGPVIFSIVFFTFFGAAFSFFSAQLLVLAADSARNLHRLTHSNLLIMQSIVNKK